MSVAKVLEHLFAAMNHARGACDRTRQLVAIAVAKFRALMMIERAAA